MATTDMPTPEVPGRWSDVAATLAGPGCAVALLLACYGPVLFGGEQFAFRDAGHFYYPLYLRVQQEWQAGRWPLWDPWQNGGQPLLGNPMAAVLYPGKLIYALLPYAWAARLYVVAHTALAFVGMWALARSWGVSRAGAGLGGLSYAFGAPVLFQYGNVIYLVGAAWVPWGLRAIDRLVRQRRRRAVPELAAVLALQVLGGDPQAAYLSVVCGVGYAALLERHERRRPARRASRTLVLAVVVAVLGVWIGATLGIASWRAEVPGWRGWIWVPAVPAWGMVGAWVAWRWRRRPGDRLGPRLAGLAGAGALAAALAGAQLVPVAEFVGASNRVGENHPTALDRYSVEPYRLAELLWPGAFGRPYPENWSWIQAIPPVGDRELWEPSLYVGGLPLLLALGAAGFREGPPWRAWMTVIAVVGLAASLGKFGGPLFWARWVPGAAAALGPHDPLYSMTRDDAFLADGASSPFAWLTALLPGLGLFRFPAKLLTFAASAAAGLAALGWDDVARGRSGPLARGCVLGLALSVALLVPAVAGRGWAVARLSGRVPDSAVAGPADVAGAWAETRRGLAQGALICAFGWVLAYRGPRRPVAAGVVAVLLVGADLGLASSRLVWTAPQAAFDAVPEVARRIAAAERAAPAPGP
ncbi:MAG TPA: hypothetical protein VF590_15065, partial [Isosphaeraceae bacterium]